MPLLKVNPELIRKNATVAERVYLWRRRRDLSQGQAAVLFGLRREEWRKYESGAARPKSTLFLHNGKIEDYEYMALWRRRHGWSIENFAHAIGVSHVTMAKREAGAGEWKETFLWWTQRAA